jgi:hypothetical protein
MSPVLVGAIFPDTQRLCEEGALSDLTITNTISSSSSSSGGSAAHEQQSETLERARRQFTFAALTALGTESAAALYALAAALGETEHSMREKHCRALLEGGHDVQAEALAARLEPEALARETLRTARRRLRVTLAHVARQPWGARLLATLDADMCVWVQGVEGSGSGGSPAGDEAASLKSTQGLVLNAQRALSSASPQRQLVASVSTFISALLRGLQSEGQA